MSDFPKVSEGIFDAVKTNTELFLELVGQYFPEAIKDGEVDFTALKEEMGEFAEVTAEHYDFTWAGKQAAKKQAQADAYGRTLRFKPKDSVNADTTENLYIEGDNLEALMLLRRAYYGKIKMIYIDPPYNTGSDFVYRDNFSMSEKELSELSGDISDNERMRKNIVGNGKYHTNWINMIYPRLKIAKDLLSEEGSIFISIDDNEIENLRKVCDEIFGETNFIAQLSVIVKTEGRQYGHFAKTHEYILVYAKSAAMVEMNEIKVVNGEFKYKDSKGGFNTIGLRNRAVRIFNSTNRPNLRYPFYVDIANKDEYGFSKVSTVPLDGWVEVWASVVDGLESVWRWGKETAEKNKDELVALQGNDGEIRIFKKDRDLTTLPKTVWFDKELNSIVGTREVAALVGKGLFDFPKPLFLLKQIVEIATDENSLVLDFFSGSSTTAHAVMQLNAEDGGKRKFIMVQLPETTEVDSEAYKAGYKNICEIGKERIRRAAKKIHEENPDAVFDDGFLCFETADTNIRWNKMTDDEILDLDRLTMGDDAIDFVEGFTDTDVVYEIMLRQYGIPLSTPIVKMADISDRTYIFNDAVVVCLESKISKELIEKLAAIEPIPAKFILRDSAFGDNYQLKETAYRRLTTLIGNHQSEEEKRSKYNTYTVEFI